MGKTILIADDEPSIVVSLEYLLEQAGYQVRIARDGQEALTAAQTHRPDLMLLDVMLPLMNGFDVCREIRGTPALQGTRIVMLTAKGRDIEINKGLALGADAYVTKPFSTRELMATIARLLEG
ncbi:response regulator [Aquincola sp. S2]|uniref:Response regulator n=1 Tax=Pseudaquabacterium terrae TaxID=2732868 RepID=A0ABX2EG66_9BURK|nr:response regulator [Aquabacterium terrae]NRF67635.1 response regulator [Aquabacterium terrae]